MNTPQFNARSLESGQAIVLLALVMVGLLASLGLAIDGGGLFLLQRNAQNAVDAAVLSATYARCTAGTSPVDAALTAAEANGFANDGTTNTITVNIPPQSGERAGDPDYVEIILQTRKESYFIQLVYPGPLEVTVRAVAYCRPPFNPTTLPPLWAGWTVCSDTVNWTGSSATVEGGIFSNNELKFGGGGNGNTIIGPTTAVKNVQTSNGGNATFDPAPVYGPDKVEVQSDPVGLRLRDFAPGGSVSDRVLENSGIYHVIRTSADDPDFDRGEWKPRNGRILAGLYYVDGDVKLGNGVVYDPLGVTIATTGEISGCGGASWRYYIDGILLYTDHEATNCGDDGISVSGSRSIWYGVIYAPNTGVNISGSNLTIYGAIIGDRIDISGSNLVFDYDPTLLPPRPPLVQIAE